MRTPIDTSVPASTVHPVDKRFAAHMSPEGGWYWHIACAPNPSSTTMDYNVGQLRCCGFCGSMHPADVAAAIRAGAQGEWADRKYGWPHKAYFERIPNPHAGMPEVRGSSSRKDEHFTREVREPRYGQYTGERVADYVHYTEEPKPAPATTHGKFYSVHLQDATTEDRLTIEQHLGIMFSFDTDGGVSWRVWCEQGQGEVIPPDGIHK